MRKAILASVLLAVVLPLVSCQPYRLESTDYETVVTVYNKSTDFGTYTTFALADSLVEIGDDVEVTHIYDQQILQQIRTNMLARGYQEVDDPDTADMVLLTGVTTFTVEVSGCYSWGGYWGWYYPGYPGYCYPYSGYAYDYKVGTVILLMVDGKNSSPGPNNASLMWTAVLGGLIEGFTTIQELLDNVDTAFTQSPYLTK